MTQHFYKFYYRKLDITGIIVLSSWSQHVVTKREAILDVYVYTEHWEQVWHVVQSSLLSYIETTCI